MDYSKLSVKELKTELKRRGATGYSQLTKKLLINNLEFLDSVEPCIEKDEKNKQQTKPERIGSRDKSKTQPPSYLLEYDDMSKQQLLSVCKEYSIKGCTTKNKAELIEHVKANMTGFKNLPYELYIEIGEHLDPKSLARFRSTSQGIYYTIRPYRIWQKMTFNEALKSGNMEAIHYHLTEGKVSQEIKDKTLQNASEQGNSKLVEILVEHKADPNAYDEENTNSLEHALMNGHGDIAKYLYKNGARLDLDDAEGIREVLYRTTETGDVESTKFLLDLGIDFHAGIGDIQNKEQLELFVEAVLKVDDPEDPYVGGAKEVLVSIALELEDLITLEYMLHNGFPAEEGLSEAKDVEALRILVLNLKYYTEDSPRIPIILRESGVDEDLRLAYAKEYDY